MRAERHPGAGVAGDPGKALTGRRVVLRSLRPADFDAWSAVRERNREWLTKWEPRRAPGQPEASESREAFAARCRARDRERQLGTGYGFGIFLREAGAVRSAKSGEFLGEINLNSVQRGPFQNAYVGYWIDEAHAGKGYVPEAVVVLARFAFEELALHRLQIAIIPRNKASRRVVEKLGIREEGIAVRYLEINGVWEDHIRYAMTAEEWRKRRGALLAEWAYPES